MEKDEENTKTESSSESPKPAKKSSRIKRSTVIGLTVLVSVWAVVGGFGGYFVYTLIHPAGSGIKTIVGGTNIPSEETVQKELKNNTLLDDYKDKAYCLLNYAFNKQAGYTNTLTITRGNVQASIANQAVQSCTLSTPDGVYNQNISSGFVSTANRFYDNGDGKIQAYVCSKTSDWPNKTADVETYDQYIQKYGKLFRGKYYCVTQTDTSKITDDNPVSDIFLTNDAIEYAKSEDKTRHIVNGVSIYYIASSTVTTSSIVKNDNGYRIQATLNPAKGADSYYLVQMKTTGGVNVSFKSTTLDYQLDEDLDLVSCRAEDTYTAVGAAATQILCSYYFHSDTTTFNSVSVSIPATSDTSDFAGFQLFPATDA
jgi:hypothetical protein